MMQARGGPAEIASADMGCMNKMQITPQILGHKTARRVVLHNVQELRALSWRDVCWCLQALCSNQLTAVTELLLVPVPAGLQSAQSDQSHVPKSVVAARSALCARVALQRKQLDPACPQRRRAQLAAA